MHVLEATQGALSCGLAVVVLLAPGQAALRLAKLAIQSRLALCMSYGASSLQ
jgi:hypothetical protein